MFSLRCNAESSSVLCFGMTDSLSSSAAGLVFLISRRPLIWDGKREATRDWS